MSEDTPTPKLELKVSAMSVAITETIDSRVPISADDLLALSNEKDYELVNGQLVEHHRGFESSHIAGQLFGFLFLFFNQKGRLGWIQIAECGYLLPLPGGNTVRKPGVSYVSFQKLPAAGGFPAGYPAIAPDLAVEVVSPHDLAYVVESKINEYLLAGVRLIWVINPASRSVQVYRQNGTITRLLEAEELDGEDVLPGFRCSIRSLLEVPHEAK